MKLMYWYVGVALGAVLTLFSYVICERLALDGHFSMSRMYNKQAHVTLAIGMALNINQCWVDIDLIRNEVDNRWFRQRGAENRTNPLYWFSSPSSSSLPRLSFSSLGCSSCFFSSCYCSWLCNEGKHWNYDFIALNCNELIKFWFSKGKLFCWVEKKKTMNGSMNVIKQQLVLWQLISFLFFSLLLKYFF